MKHPFKIPWRNTGRLLFLAVVIGVEISKRGWGRQSVVKVDWQGKLQVRAPEYWGRKMSENGSWFAAGERLAGFEGDDVGMLFVQAF